jgi:hypothetical protein
MDNKMTKQPCCFPVPNRLLEDLKRRASQIGISFEDYAVQMLKLGMYKDGKW